MPHGHNSCIYPTSNLGHCLANHWVFIRIERGFDSLGLTGSFDLFPLFFPFLVDDPVIMMLDLLGPIARLFAVKQKEKAVHAVMGTEYCGLGNACSLSTSLRDMNGMRKNQQKSSLL